MCGEQGNPLERDVRFQLPEPVLRAPLQERTPGTWMSHEDAASSVMMQVPDLGPFVRVLLPVSLRGGYSITFGLWLGVHPDDLQRAFEQWWAPTYPQLVLEGRIANDIPPWGLLAEPATALVRDQNETPYLASSPDALTNQVITEQWEHDAVLHPGAG